MRFSFERFSLTSAFARLRRDEPALSRLERENNLPMVCAVTTTMVHGPNAALQKTEAFHESIWEIRLCQRP
jgi:hypothetical protein